MRIALITPEFITDGKFDGGLANYTYRAALSLTELGHEVEVLVKGNTTETSEMEGFTVRKIDTTGNVPLSLTQRVQRKLGMGKTEGALLQALKRNAYWINQALEEAHAQQPYDIAHYAHLGGLAYGCPKQIPSVIRISSSTRLCHERGGYGQTDSEMEQQEWIENEAMKQVSSVFGPSRMIAGYIGNQIDRAIEVIETPFKLNTGDWDASVYQSRLAEKEYFLFYGSLAQLKGVETIGRCLNEVLTAHPTLHFVFIGKVFDSTSGQPMDEYLKAQAGAHADRCHLMGRMRHEQLYPIIQQAKAVVLPSLVDNFPNTCIESMALKRIVVGTEKNGFEQLIDNGESGYLIPIDDDRKLLETLRKIQNLTDEQSDAIGAKAAERIKDLEPEKVVGQLVEYYQKVIV